MATSTVRLVGAALVVAAVGCCSTAPPKETLIPTAIPCPAPNLPARPVVERCLPADTDSECATRAITSLVLLEGYTEKLEVLLAVYAAKPLVPPVPH